MINLIKSFLFILQKGVEDEENNYYFSRKHWGRVFILHYENTGVGKHWGRVFILHYVSRMKTRPLFFPSLFSHIFLADVYAELGRKEESRNPADDALRINPGFSLKKTNKISTFKNKDPAHLERRLNALRKAGIPE